MHIALRTLCLWTMPAFHTCKIGLSILLLKFIALLISYLSKPTWRGRQKNGAHFFPRYSGRNLGLLKLEAKKQKSVRLFLPSSFMSFLFFCGKIWMEKWRLRNFGWRSKYMDSKCIFSFKEITFDYLDHI